MQSEQTFEYILPAGTAIDFAAANPVLVSNTNQPVAHERILLDKPVPVRLVSRDRTETSIGGAQKDTVRELATKAAALRPVMWAGIGLMTLVAGAFIYFGWWTKAGAAVAIGIGMIVLAQLAPDHGTAILLGGLGLFTVIALLVLYAYYKGQLDKNENGQ